MAIETQYIYSVTVQVDPEVELAWLEYMMGTHVPDVLATGCFLSYRMLKMYDANVGGTSDDSGPTYNFQYLVASQALLKAYREQHAPALQADVLKYFEGRFVAFRTVLQVVSMG